jgi:hypothetical protein
MQRKREIFNRCRELAQLFRRSVVCGVIGLRHPRKADAAHDDMSISGG